MEELIFEKEQIIQRFEKVIKEKRQKNKDYLSEGAKNPASVVLHYGQNILINEHIISYSRKMIGAIRKDDAFKASKEMLNDAMLHCEAISTCPMQNLNNACKRKAIVYVLGKLRLMSYGFESLKDSIVF